MKNTLLYIVTVLIWGTTWYAIKLQVGLAPDELSILCRAILAAICLVGWCNLRGMSLRFEPRDHLFLCGLGLSMFSLHYLFVYSASAYLVSGLIAVVFSGVSFLSIANNALFFRAKPSINVCLGALVGISGLCVFIWHEVMGVTLGDNALTGLGLATIGTFIFSLGSSISKRNNQKGLALVPTMTIAMIYGALAMTIYTLIQGTPLVFPASTIYWASLLYLVVTGSIVAFLCYLQLIKNIGPELAGYSTELFPAVALIISSLLEGYTRSLVDFFGLLLVITGNVLVIQKASLKDILLQKLGFQEKAPST